MRKTFGILMKKKLLFLMGLAFTSPVKAEEEFRFEITGPAFSQNELKYLANPVDETLLIPKSNDIFASPYRAIIEEHARNIAHFDFKQQKSLFVYKPKKSRLQKYLDSDKDICYKKGSLGKLAGPALVRGIDNYFNIDTIQFLKDFSTYQFDNGGKLGFMKPENVSSNINPMPSCNDGSNYDYFALRDIKDGPKISYGYSISTGD